MTKYVLRSERKSTFLRLIKSPVKYSKQGLCFVLPDAGLRPQVMIPPEYIKWFSELPSTILAAGAPLKETVGIPYIVPTMDMAHDTYNTGVIRKYATRNLGRLQPDIFCDIKGSIDNLLGFDQENWREIALYDTIQEVLFKSSNRVFVGEPLCNNKVFLRSSAIFANLAGAGAVIVGELLPLVLKPVFGYAFAIPIWIAQMFAFRYLVPEIRLRMINIERKRSDPKFYWVEPKDMLTWIVVAAMERGDPREDTPEKIAQRLLFLVSLDF